MKNKPPIQKWIRGSEDDEETQGPRTPSIAPDSLRSTAYLQILDLICEGEIVGLARDSKSIYLNKTVLQNDDDSYNFKHVLWQQRKGTQNQTYIQDNPAVEREITVSAQFKYGSPTSGPQPSNTAQTGTAIVRTITNPEVTAVRVRISVPQLLTTNRTTGDVTGSSVSYSVWVQPDGGSYTKLLQDTISGKSSSKYERTRRVELPGTGPWLLRVQRDTADAPDTYTQNTTVFESYTEITDAKLTYPNSALIGIQIDATQFNSVPSRIYEMDLLKIQVPVNYDDVTKTYTGTWNGTFKMSTGACSNPAWVFYDLLTSDRYGLGQYIDALQIDKWALYEIGRYCDELVPDGRGSTEHRFTCNVFIPSRTEAYNLLKSLASIFRGMIYWSQGSITATQDSPKDAVYLYTPSNVVDGKFSYQGASAQAKHTVARVSWNDPSNFYETAVEYVEDEDAIREQGVIETDIVAFGCTSRGQANRLGRWLLYTEQYESETVTFSTGLDAVSGLPGNVIQIADPTKAGVRLGGRVSTATTLAVTIDDDVDTNTTGSLLVLLPNGTLEERLIVSIVGRVVTVAAPYSLAPQSQAVWVIKSSTVEPQTFRIVAISEGENGTYSITAIRHNPSKYDFIENNLTLEIADTSDLEAAPAKPENLRVSETLYTTGTDVKSKATFGWDKVPLASNYRVSYSYNNGNTITLPVTQFNEIEIFDTQPGNYIFYVVAINSLGKVSPEASLEYEIQGKTLPPQDVQNFSMIPSHGNALLSWDRATDLDVLIGGYVRVRWTPRLTGQLWSDGIDITPAITGNSTQVVAPLLSGTYMVKFVDSTGNYSVNEKLIITTMADIHALNTVEEITEDPTFDGVMTNMMYVPDEQAITLTSSATMDDVLEIDGLGTWDFFGGIDLSGEYAFDNSLNMGGIWPFKVRVHVDLEAYDTGNFIDQRFDLIDDWDSFDGDIINALDAQVYMRTTEDDPTGSPTWTDWKKIINAEYVAWGAEFKIICTNDASNHNLFIRELAVTVDMDDRTWNSGKLTSSTSADYFVDFGSDFFTIPSISVTAENMATGDYYVISNTGEDGFDISFYNSGGTRVQRDFYILAKSYGLRLT